MQGRTRHMTECRYSQIRRDVPPKGELPDYEKYAARRGVRYAYAFPVWVAHSTYALPVCVT